LRRTRKVKFKIRIPLEDIAEILVSTEKDGMIVFNQKSSGDSFIYNATHSIELLCLIMNAARARNVKPSIPVRCIQVIELESIQARITFNTIADKPGLTITKAGKVKVLNVSVPAQERRRSSTYSVGDGV
jgi:hypothetical protein